MTQSLYFENNLKGELHIHEIKGSLINKKCGDINIKRLTTHSISLISSLKLPLTHDVVYRVFTTIFNKKIELFGTFVEVSSKLGSDQYQYELSYISFTKQALPNLYELKIKQNSLRRYDESNLYVKKIVEKGVQFNEC